MNIQWYPGHMAKTKRKINESLKLIDIVIELLDARIPESSKNPDIDSIINNKPKIILLNKCDLSDPQINEEWENNYKNTGQDYIFVNSISGKGIKNLINRIEKVMQPVIEKNYNRGRVNKQIRCMIMGIPNVGKSTLINKIAGKSSAKTGNIPGVTRANQWIKVSNKIQLLDTPGILWPKFEDIETGLRLAWIGSIKDTIYDKEEVTLKLLEFLKLQYPDKIKERYKIDFDLNSTGIEIYEKIAEKRGFKSKGGNIDYSRTSDIILDELRKTKIGKISFEKPDN